MSKTVSIKILANKIEDKMKFKTKTGYYLELLNLEAMKLLRSTKSKISKDKNGENLSYLENTEAVLIHCTFINNSYEFGQMLDISPINFIFLRTFDSEFSYIKVLLTDQSSRPLKISI